MTSLILIGYRGTGKSTVARRLATSLGMPHVSLDAEIVRRAGQTITEFVAANGWDRFRELESKLVVEYSSRSGIILDCGGGVVERESNFAPLRAAGTVFWLTATKNTVVSRISDSRDRPALSTGESFLSEVESVLTRRAPLYARLAHVKIATDALAPSQVADRIAMLWPEIIRSDSPSS